MKTLAVDIRLAEDPELGATPPMRAQPFPVATTPLVAIVTPVYNGADYLEATLRCVQQQSYPNVVHVILDNASTDATAEIIDRYRGGRIPLRVQRNTTVLSQVDNWNAALKLVPPDARYVQLLCADDLLRRDAIQLLAAKAESDPDICLVGGSDVVMDQQRDPRPPAGAAADVADGRAYLASVCANTYGHFAWQAFFTRWSPADRTADLFAAGPCFDTVALMKRMTHGKVAFVRQPLIYTRHHANQLSSSFAKSHSTAMRFWRWEAALRYADLLEPARQARVIRENKHFLLRFQLYYMAVGARASAKAVADRLAADGHPARLLDYPAALLAYVPTILGRLSGKVFGRRPAPITEDAFLNWQAPA